jgi:hypothetical protein
MDEWELLDVKADSLEKNSTSCSIHIKKLCYRIGALVLMVPGKKFVKAIEHSEEVPSYWQRKESVHSQNFNFIN